MADTSIVLVGEFRGREIRTIPDDVLDKIVSEFSPQYNLFLATVNHADDWHRLTADDHPEALTVHALINETYRRVGEEMEMQAEIQGVPPGQWDGTETYIPGLLEDAEGSLRVAERRLREEKEAIKERVADFDAEIRRRSFDA